MFGTIFKKNKNKILSSRTCIAIASSEIHFVGSIFFCTCEYKIMLATAGSAGEEVDRGAGRWESAQNLNSRSLTVADHGIQAMPPRRVLLNELKITGPRLFLGQSSAESDRDRWRIYARAREIIREEGKKKD